MRVNKLGIGVLIAAAVVLTGCSAGGSDTAAPKPSGAASQEAEAPAADCPELSEGATIDGPALSACMTEAMKDTAGYAATSKILTVETTTRVNPSEKAFETTSPAGSIIVIGDDAWVKPTTGDWQPADSKSSDPIISGLSTGAENASSVDPTATVAAGLKGTFTVTGTGERLGQKVFLVSGSIDEQGMTGDLVLEITSDYAILANNVSATMEGQSVEMTTEMTEWDKAQDIVAPL